MAAEFFHGLLMVMVNYGIVAFEFFGVMILFISGGRGIWDYFRKSPTLRLNLANGMAMGLEFKLGSEILRTVVVRDLSECVIVGVIIILRAGLAFLIHWEIQTERDEEKHNAELERERESKA